METCDTAIVDGRVILPGVGVMPGSLGIRDGVVVYLGTDRPPADDVIDAAGRYVMPGAVDPHVHLFGSEDFARESRSAAAGGVTTMIIYLLNRESYAPIHDEYEAAGREGFADFAFHYAIVSRSHLDEMPDYVKKKGVRSFKFFMTARASEAERLGLAPVDDGLLLDFMRRCAELGAVACVHCENLEIAKSLERRLRQDGREDLAAWAECRPGYVEADGVLKALNLADAAGLETLYIVHLSSRQGLHALAALDARATVETCIQYLTITCDADVGPLAKVNPPVKYAADVEALWAAVQRGTVTTVGTDHSPRGIDKKGGDIWTASPGFPGLATLVPLLLTEGTRRDLPIERLCELVCSNPARRFGLYPRKGTLLPGSDADVVILDAEDVRVIHASELESAAGFSPYEGLRVRFWPSLTLLRGRRVFRDGQVMESSGGAARYLTRSDDNQYRIRG